MNELLYKLTRLFSKKIPDGMIGVGSSSEDFLLSSITNIESEIKLKKPADLVIYQWNQYKYYWSSMFCTCVAPACILSSMFNKELTDEDFKDLFNYAKEFYGYREGRGAHMKTGVECVASRWNNRFPKLAVMYFRSDLHNSVINVVIENNFGVVVAYQGNEDYNKDKYDRLLQGVSFGIPIYGHVTALYKNHVIYDSNKGAFDEKYKIYPGNLPKLLDNGVFYSECYVYLPVDADWKFAKRKQNLQDYLLSIKAKRLGVQ